VAGIRFLTRLETRALLAVLLSGAVAACGGNAPVGQNAGGSGGSGGSGGALTGGHAGNGCPCQCLTRVSAGGCSDLCDEAQNGGVPSYCNGVAPGAECAMCLETSCHADAAMLADTAACL
jgi:hypothetical protein